MRIIGAQLPQRLADSLSGSAMRLSVNDEWVDGSADIVDRRIANQFECAGLAIDLDLADMRAVGKTKLQDGFVACCLESAAQIFRHAFAACCRCRDVKNSKRTIGALNSVATAGEYDVVFGGFEHMGRDVLALLDNRISGFAHDDTGEAHRSGGVRAATLLDDVG